MGASLGSSFCFFKCSFLKHPSHVDIKRFLDFVLQVSNVSWNTCLVAKFWMSRRQVKSGRRFLTLPDKEVKRNIALGKFWMIIISLGPVFVHSNYIWCSWLLSVREVLPCQKEGAFIKGSWHLWVFARSPFCLCLKNLSQREGFSDTFSELECKRPTGN